ncbi:Transcriptional regulator, LuxR family [Modestobacter italicus]|uniref:Transcriptional regulator, LuxR family n=1 Tax=Modestobacter italicus (strain DSM 44449 / CECT 9708 / BC 501) TaxID=2732864 RepID=I4EVJ8_MODI5|nr:LuxR family transcriptional regulator [Modestobacter marinus]CCH87411.1 Transcriptional regulator, LuxR family [Modestobacter marinus]
MGRHAERAAADQLLASARAGRSGALVVRGEAGIGKTALLEHVRRTALSSDFRVRRSVGVESETQFAFSGLHQLCAPLLDHLDALPAPQQAALGVAFGLRGGPAPDRFLVGLAALNVLAEVAEEAPLLCLVDDGQWLDQASAQVLAFVARRVAAERVALVFALRDPTGSDVDPFAGLPELRLDGLTEADARTLLAAEVPTPLDDDVCDRIVAEARGNPLALLELPRGAQPSQLAGGFELPDVLSVPRRIEDVYQRRSGSLPVETQLLLLVAAAEPTGDPALLWRAADHLGVDRETAAPAEAAGLVEIGTRVRFRHPLVRSAVYRAATPPDRRRAHGALAAATDPQVDPDRRAWHRAQALSGTDEEVAAELELSADRARARGGSAAAGAFLQRAAELTPEPARRAGRALEAAQVKHQAGASEAALELLTVAAAGPLDARQRARLQLLRARVDFQLTRADGVSGMLLDAAAALAPLDAALARETYLHALDAALVIGGSGRSRSVLDVATAARAAPAPPGPAGTVDLLLDGLVATYTRGYGSGVPGLRRALEAFRSQETAGPGRYGDDSWLWLASRTAVGLYDDELALVLVDRHVRLTREAGALSALPAALTALSVTLLLAGELTHAAELAAESTAITRVTGARPLRNAQLVLAAWCGRGAETRQLHASTVQAAGGSADGAEVTIAQYALAVLHNGLGDHPAAEEAAALASASSELANSNLALPELVEAAVRSGRPERAAAAVEQLGTRARASGTPWALGLEARSRAMISAGPVAEEHYREAIEQLRGCRIATHLARTHLVYGEWLRREGRRQDARDQLRTAHAMLSEMGAEAFAARAARELRATGEHPRTRTARPTDALTAQELHIARLVATGATSREVGAQLFLSPRTIEAHLRNIFRKAGITSRRQLRELQLP